MPKFSSLFSLPSFNRVPLMRSSSDAAFNQTEPLLQLWAAFFGILLFGTFILYTQGVWASLWAADPTYLTALIVVLFFGATIWVGRRANTLSYEYQQFVQFEQILNHKKVDALTWLQQSPSSWAKEFFLNLYKKGDQWRDNAQLSALLGEKASSAHEMAWWVNGVLLKLGLLGKVIGFSIMAIQLGSLESFDAGQTSAVLKTLTGGLGIALLTTMTGLTANILLGLQLMRLDRFADTLTAKAIKIAEVDLGEMIQS